MRALFTTLSLLPIQAYKAFAYLIILSGIYKLTDAYKITKANLEIILPNASKEERIVPTTSE